VPAGGARTSALDWLLLTKRPEQIVQRVPGMWLERPRRNVWYGTTVENQEYAEERIPALLRVPAAVRFLSCEPLLESLNLHAALCANGHLGGSHPEQQWCDSICTPRGGIHWVIVGGESGRKPRPFALAWARSIVAQCRAAAVPAFVKQLGAQPVADDGETLHALTRKGGDLSELPADLRVREWPAS
jgi:protein gp37